jgi:hypothetical protein
MRIALVVSGRLHVFDLARGLAAYGHDVTVLTDYPVSVWCHDHREELARMASLMPSLARSRGWRAVASQLANLAGACVGPTAHEGAPRGV